MAPYFAAAAVARRSTSCLSLPMPCAPWVAEVGNTGSWVLRLKAASVLSGFASLSILFATITAGLLVRLSL